MRGLERDARKAEGVQQRHQRRIVCAFNHRQLKVGACFGRLLHRIKGRHVPEVSNEVDAIRRDDRNRCAAGEIGQVQNVGTGGDDECVHTGAGARGAHGIVPSLKRWAGRVRHGPL